MTFANRLPTSRAVVSACEMLGNTGENYPARLRLTAGTSQAASCSQLREVSRDPTLNLAEEIATMWRFTRNNGIPEGFHTKMEVLQRQAYGFRNFENDRLRVRVMCR